MELDKVIQKMRALHAEEPLTPLQAEQELLDAGVDVKGFEKRLSAKLRIQLSDEI
jgi:hypothetical protein